jgi:hypothetical protein
VRPSDVTGVGSLKIRRASALGIRFLAGTTPNPL